MWKKFSEHSIPFLKRKKKDSSMQIGDEGRYHTQEQWQRDRNRYHLGTQCRP